MGALMEKTGFNQKKVANIVFKLGAGTDQKCKQGCLCEGIMQ